MTRAAAGQFVAVCFAIFLVVWIVAAFWSKPTAERSGWRASWLMRGALIGVVVWLGRRAAHGAAQQVLWPYTPGVGLFVVCSTMLGLAIVLWARLTLAGNWSADVVFKENHELIERGPYRYVRHPIYTGVILMVVGPVLLWATPAAVAMAVGVPLLLWLKLSDEERLLTRHFPEEYPRYKSRVKALVPFII
jgi:protein-S-isoprenylcysteine O-methyltransferase Ste14